MKNDKTDPYVSAIIFQLLGGVFVAIVAFIHGFQMPPFQEYPINFLLNAILWGSATALLFKAYQYLEASEATILATLETIVAIISAVLFLNERFDLLMILGTILICASVIYISYKKGELKLNKGVLYILAYSVFAGLGITNDAFLIQRLDPLSYLSFGFILPGIFILIIRSRRLKIRDFKLTKIQMKNVSILTLAYTFGASAFTLAIAYGGQASQITPINQSSIILTVVLAAIFLKERDQLFKKFICAILVSIGVLLLSR